MPLQQTNEGLQIQPVSEIIDELRTAFRDPVTGYGAGVKVLPNTGFGQMIQVWSEREALLQQLLQRRQADFDPNSSEGTDLDVIAELTATFRRDEDQSASGAGQIQGTPGTVIADGSRVQNVETGDIWEIAGGDPSYTITAGNFVNCTIIAQEPGPLEFAAGTTWAIIDTVPGWSTFVTTEDIDPEDIGNNDEQDASLRQRREDELFSGGNDLSAIRAEVSKVVDEVAAYENRDCSQPSPDGIPEGAFEIVVEGGDDQAIIDAIYSRKPPGAESYGQTVTSSVNDEEGNPVPIGFTRVGDINIWMDIVITRGGAEVSYPENAGQLVEDAVLEVANASTKIGQDVIPESYIGVVYETLKDPETGKYPMENVVVNVGTSPATAPNVIAIGIRERADYDSARTTVSFLF